MFSNSDFRVFLFTYRHDGAEWCFELPAKDERDAKARLAKIHYATYNGELRAKIPAKAGFLARAVVLVRNMLYIGARKPFGSSAGLQDQLAEPRQSYAREARDGPEAHSFGERTEGGSAGFNGGAAHGGIPSSRVS